MADNSILSRISGALFGGSDAPAETAYDDAAPADMEKAKPIPSNTIGSSVGGFGTETIYADRQLNLLGTRRWDVYRDMVQDIAIVGASLRLILNLMANAVWTVEPPANVPEGQKEEAQRIADLTYDILFDMTTSWSSVVKKTAMFRFAGFSLQEWTAKRRPDGAIGFLDIEHRPQRTITGWVRDESGTIVGVKQRVAGRSEVMIPRAKLVYAVDDTLTDEPEGVGLFRHLAATVRRLESFFEIQETGFETDLRGIPIARAPLGELQKEVEEAGPIGSESRRKAEAKRVAMLRPLREFVEKHIRNKKTGLFFPSDTYQSQDADKLTPSAVPKWAIELLNGDSQAFEAIAAEIKEMKQDLARMMGTEHLLLGSDGSGSLALARSKVGTFYQTVTSALQDLVEIYDRDLIEPLSDMNGFPEELRPQMGVNEISDRDLDQVMAALKDLATAGAPILPDDPAVRVVYNMMGLPAPEPRTDDMDASLNPSRNEPRDPDDEIEGDPEADVAKRRIIKSRRSRKRRA